MSPRDLAPVVWDLEIDGHRLPYTGAMCLPSDSEDADYHVLVYGTRLPHAVRTKQSSFFPLTLVAGASEEECLPLTGTGRVKSLREDGPGYVLRLAVRLSRHQEAD